MSATSEYCRLHINPNDPDFTVHVYTVGNVSRTPDPTTAALREADQHAYIFNVEDDPVAHHYVTDVLDHYTWPVVTITAGAELVAHWEGYRPDMIDLIPSLRESCHAAGFRRTA